MFASIASALRGPRIVDREAVQKSNVDGLYKFYFGRAPPSQCTREDKVDAIVEYCRTCHVRYIPVL